VRVVLFCFEKELVRVCCCVNFFLFKNFNLKKLINYRFLLKFQENFFGAKL